MKNLPGIDSVFNESDIGAGYGLIRTEIFFCCIVVRLNFRNAEAFDVSVDDPEIRPFIMACVDGELCRRIGLQDGDGGDVDIVTAGMGCSRGACRGAFPDQHGSFPTESQ